MHVLVLGSSRVQLVAFLLGLDVGVMEGDGRITNRHLSVRLGGIVTIARQINFDASAAFAADGHGVVERLRHNHRANCGWSIAVSGP